TDKKDLIFLMLFNKSGKPVRFLLKQFFRFFDRIRMENAFREKFRVCGHRLTRVSEVHTSGSMTVNQHLKSFFLIFHINADFRLQKFFIFCSQRLAFDEFISKISDRFITCCLFHEMVEVMKAVWIKQVKSGIVTSETQ